MYVPQQQSLEDLFQQNGAGSGTPAGIGSLAPARPSSEGGFPVMDALKLGKFGFQALAPDAYSSATSWIPSLSDLGISFGAEGLGGLGSAAGGLMSAAGYAGPMLAFAKLMSAINQNTDHPITLGSGYTSLEDGFYGGSGPKVEEAQGLSNLYRGDGGWYAGGDPSMTDDLDTSFGSMSWKKNIPAWTVGGAPYRSPELAVNSGRQIARGQMGLPVTLEDLPNSFSPGADPGLLAKYMGNQSLPVWDAPQAMPSDWDMWQDRAQNSSYSGQSNTEAGAWAPETIQAYVQAMDPRAQEWFRSGLTSGQMYAYTGENSPDWGQINEYDLSSAKDDTLSRVAAANGIEGTAPLDVFSYAMGPGRIFNPGRTNL